jgi:hypothetical protein
MPALRRTKRAGALGDRTMRHAVSISNLVFGFVLLMLPTTARAGGVALTQCGQILEGENRAFLTGDLDCQGTDFGVKFPGRGILELNGFTLKNTFGGGVWCQTNCKIVGPGSIIDGTLGYSPGVTGGKVTLQTVTVANHASDGVVAARLATLRDSTVQGNKGNGVQATRVKARNSQIIDNATNGIYLVTGYPSGVAPNPQLQLEDVVATGNGAACGIDDVCADLNAPIDATVRGALTCETSYNSFFVRDMDLCSQD